MNLADRLNAVNILGSGLLVRWIKMKAKLSSSKKSKRGLPVLENPAFSKTVAAFTKKFPEFMPDLEKVPGYQEMVLKAHEHLAELEPWYSVFIDIVDWKEAAMQLLRDTGQQCATLEIAANPNTTVHFLNLIRTYVRVHLALKEWGADKAIRVVTTYYRMYYHHKCKQEPNYSRIATWITTFQNSIAELSVEFHPLFGKLVDVFSGSYVMSYSKSRDYDQLRKNGSLSLTIKPDDLALPTDDVERFELLHYNDLHEWFVFALLACPNLLEAPTLPALIKLALVNGGYCLSLYRNVVVYPHELLDAICKEAKTGKTLSKQRKIIQTFGKEAVASFAAHRNARVFAIQECTQLLALCNDSPGLCAPKLPTLLAAASVARSEAAWLLMHQTAAPPADYRRYKREDLGDPRTAELVFVSERITALLRRFSKPIQDYYEEFARGADIEALSGSPSTEVKAMVQALQAGDWQTAIESWHRGQVSAAATPGNKSAGLWRAHRATLHALWAHDLMREIQEWASPSALWWWSDSLYQLFENALGATDKPDVTRSVMAFVRLCHDVPSLASPFYSKERDRLGKEAVNQANKCLIKITKRVCFLLHDIAMAHMRLDHMLADINAVHQVFRTVNRDWKPPKDYVPQPVPGAESSYKEANSGESARLRALERACWRLCSAIGEQNAVVVYNHAFSPREYLREKLHLQLINFMRTCVAPDDKAGTIQRPSVLERRVGVYSSVLQAAEHYIAIDTSELLRDAFLGEVYAKSCGETGSLDYVSKKPDPEAQSMVAALTNWYAAFANTKLAKDAVYSPARKAFAARRGAPVPFEQWTDLDELAALCRLVGPYGAKQLDQRLLTLIAHRIKAVRDALTANAGPLGALAKNFYHGPAVADAVKRISGLEQTVTDLVHLGALQTLRRLLREALRTAMSTSVPMIHETCELAHSTYLPNSGRDALFLPTDALAADAGVDTFRADAAFLSLLAKTAADEAWDYLPYLFAASFFSQTVKEAVFNSSANAHTNNAHCIPRGVVDVVVGVVNLRPSGAKDPRRARRRVEHLVEVAAAQALRLVEEAKDGHSKGYSDLPGVVLLLDATLKTASPLADRATIERVCPYALLRNCYTETYDARKLVGHRTDEF